MKETVFLDHLKLLKEWMAYGFYANEDEPWPIPYGKAWRCLYENMDIRIFADRLMAPCEPLPNAQNKESHNIWFPTSMICDFSPSWGLRANRNIADMRKLEYPELAEFIDDLYLDLARNFREIGGYTHCNLDMRRVVSEGVIAMEAELDAALNAASTPEEQAFLRALKEYVAGVKSFHHRTLLALQEAACQATGELKTKRQLIANAFAHCGMVPAESFIEGLLAVNFTWMLDDCDSIGRLDQVLGDLFERDIRSGAIDLAFARELLDEVWRNFERFNGWNLQVGGRLPSGADGANALTRECILACQRNRFRRPNVAFRISNDTPDELVALAVEAVANGTGRPAFYNDDLYIRSLLELDLGLTPEDAVEYGFGGCSETMIPGMSNVGSLEGDINLAKALELALNDGFDPVRKMQFGPHTGKLTEFICFEEFFNAVKRQIQYLTDTFVFRLNQELAVRFTAGDPKLYRSFFTRDCVKRHRSFEAGGARYNWSVVSYQGIANAIDGIAAVKQLVFEEKSVRPDELLLALADDFQHHQALQSRLLAVPKFGNDQDYVDNLGRDLIDFAWRELGRHTPPRGGRYVASCILFVTYWFAGKEVAATPDGRHAFKPLADSVGAFAGCDTQGPTALLNSICKLPLSLAVGTPVVNLRLSKEFVNTPQGVNHVVSLIRTFFQRGGLQLQFTIVDTQTMRAAQEDPGSYNDLIVRIGGYSEYFNMLDKSLQDSVIARNEYELC